ncbi:hypothetical protein VTO73DRAFT_1906 [Trametes versicolor]
MPVSHVRYFECTAGTRIRSGPVCARPICPSEGLPFRRHFSHPIRAAPLLLEHVRVGLVSSLPRELSTVHLRCHLDTVSRAPRSAWPIDAHSASPALASGAGRVQKPNIAAASGSSKLMDVAVHQAAPARAQGLPAAPAGARLSPSFAPPLSRLFFLISSGLVCRICNRASRANRDADRRATHPCVSPSRGGTA